MRVLVVSYCSKIHFWPPLPRFEAQGTTFPRLPYLLAFWMGSANKRCWEKVEGGRRGKSPFFPCSVSSQVSVAGQPFCSCRTASSYTAQLPLKGPQPVQLCLGTTALGLLEPCLLHPAPGRWRLLAIADLWVVLPLLLPVQPTPSFKSLCLKALNWLLFSL